MRQGQTFESMRRNATGLLLLMTGVFVVSYLQPSEHPAWSYVRAFAEAAMVGGLADWFAVTALFRRPLGLPIPHTAIIPRNQGRIADALGQFIAENFLAPDLVAERVKGQDLAAALGRWLAKPEQTERLADGLVSAVPAIFDALRDETVAEFLRKQAAAQMTGARLAPAAASLLEALAAQNHHQALLDAALNEAWKWVETNEEDIRARVKTRTGWFWRIFTVDSKAADALIGAIEDFLNEAARDPGHPLRLRINELVYRFADDLKNDPAIQTRIEAMTREAFTHPAVSGALSAAWAEMKTALRRDVESETSQLRAWVVEGLRRIGHGLLEDERVRTALNDRLRVLVVELATRHGKDVSKLVSDTIRGWDSATVVSKLEQNVGKDLQYIRLNGTVIGGLVGLTLHAFGDLLSTLGG